MYYFVPSWYSSERPWYNESPLWFRVYDRIQFDDTINQYRMFSSLGENTRLLILNYYPQLRYFLHKQDLLGSEYWSVFDDIQNIHKVDTAIIDFKALDWPEGISFVYTPFAVVAMSGKEVFAYVHFAENGNLLSIDFQKDQTNSKRYIFDDRGFLSSILYFNSGGTPSHQDYLNEYGVWQVRETFQDGDVLIEVNRESDKKFSHQFYYNWEDLIQERLQQFKELWIFDRDTVVCAADDQHNDILRSVFVTNKKVFSFFEKRYDYMKDLSKTEALLSDTDLVILDTADQERRMLSAVTKSKVALSKLKTLRISIFDTRLRLGHSQNIKELLVYFYIDTISDQELQIAARDILKIMNENPLIELDIVSFDQYRNLDQVKAFIEAEIKQQFPLENFYVESESEGLNQIDEAQYELKSIRFNMFTNETQVISQLDRTRLIIDLGEKPDLYTQIAGISAGIPQINIKESEYINHMKNGWILTDMGELNTAIHHYFDGLSNWNASLVYAVQKMSDYSSGRLLTQWKQLLENT